jgi:hypothetical protein
VVQKGKQSLPEDGIVLPKNVGAIVKENKEVYNFNALGWSLRKHMQITSVITYWELHFSS